MGQYHLVVNLDKKEYLHPHKLGCGLKLMEQVGGIFGGTGDALLLLLACSASEDGYDVKDSSIIGRWAGDRIAMVGDYANNTDLPPEFEASTIYSNCINLEDGYTDITVMIRGMLEKNLMIQYAPPSYDSSNWGSWLSVHDLTK